MPPGKDLTPPKKKCNSAAFVFLLSFPLSSGSALESRKLRMGFQPQASQLVFGAEHLGRLPSPDAGVLAAPVVSHTSAFTCPSAQVSADFKRLLNKW